jgi:hypothetical protein
MSVKPVAQYSHLEPECVSIGGHGSASAKKNTGNSAFRKRKKNRPIGIIELI